MTQDQYPDRNDAFARAGATPTGADLTGAEVADGQVTGAEVAGDEVAGATIISDTVITKIIGIAVREVPGVKGIGGGASRAFGALRGAMGSGDPGQGVRVKVQESDVSVDLVIVADYPVALQEVAAGVRTAVVRAIEDLVGLRVAQVNVTVGDVEVPEPDEPDASAAGQSVAPGAGVSE